MGQGVPARAPRFESTLHPRGEIHQPAGQLAHFLSELTFADVPKEVIGVSRLVTLDTIGCIVAATQTKLGNQVLSTYRAAHTSSGCVVPGTSLRLPPSLAAKVTAWLADILDYEDTLAGHPSATVIPAALALAEARKSSYEKFLTAVVAGYEAGVRLHDATRATPETYRRFASYHAWHGVAAGAAAMCVVGGTEDQFRSALGHAAGNTNIPLWYVEYGRPAHALKANYGQMALGGVEAALCAEQEILGPFSMLSDPERGFSAIIGSDRFNPSHLATGLGTTWRISNTSFKGYPACFALHPTIGAILELMKQGTVDPNEIASVKIRGGSKLATWFSYDAPDSELDGQFAVQYVAALVLLGKEPGVLWHQDETRNDPAVQSLLAKTTVEVDPVAEELLWKGEASRASVTIVTRDLSEFSATVDWPPGHPRAPFTQDQIVAKFERNLRGTQIEGRASGIVKTVLSDGPSYSIAELVRMVAI